MTTPITEVHNRMADYIPSTGQLLIAGKNGVSRSAGINMFWGAYEPRVGAHLEDLGSDKTVLRLGFGIYHDSSWNQGAQGLWQNPPNLGESDQFPLRFPRAAPSATSYCATLLGNTGVRRSTTTPRGFPLLPTRRMCQLHRHVRLPAAPTSSPAGFTNTTPTSNASCPAMSCSPPATPVRSAAICWSSATTSTPAALRVAEPGIRLHARLPARRRSLLVSLQTLRTSTPSCSTATWQDALQLAAGQGRDQDAQKRPLRAACLHLLPHLRQRPLRRPGLGVERPLFPAAQLAESRLVSVADQSRSTALPAASSTTCPSAAESSSATAGTLHHQRHSRQLAGHADRKNLFRIPGSLIDSNNQSGTTFNTGGDDYNFNRPNQVSRLRPYNAKPRQVSVDQPLLVFPRPPSAANSAMPRASRQRTRFRQLRLLGDQAFRAAWRRRWA
jgi:hypothetical protein